ncbi:MAG TPA: hypothetical protein VJZ27_20375 [Aggregatilineales bacterium]|nr:hypothetical protein [Aggregatilineales bacterium]
MNLLLKKHHVLMLLVWMSAAVLICLNFMRYPVGNGRDEIDQLQNIEFYREEHRFPVLPDDLLRVPEGIGTAYDPSDSPLTSVQGHQPPLYYMLMATLSLPDPESRFRYEENPFLLRDNYSPDLPPYNRVFYVHHWTGKNEGYILTLQILRIMAITIHLIGLAFINLTVREIFDEHTTNWITPLTLAFIMLTPAFWRTAMIVSNNSLVFLFGAMATYFLARIKQRGLTWRLSFALGLTLGFGMLSKIYMLPLLVVTPLIFIMLTPRKTAFQHLILIGAVVLLIAGWWYWRNLDLYGDITAASATEDILQSRRVEPFTLSDFANEILTWSGEFAVESWLVLNTRVSLWFASIIGTLLMISAFVAGLRPVWRKTLLLPGAIFLAALILAVAGAKRNIHGEYSPPILLAALPSIGLLFAFGVLAWIPQRFYPQMSFSVVLLILTGTIVYQVTMFLPLYPVLHRVENIDDLDVTNRVSVDFENGARLVGYELENRWLAPGDWTRVKLCWQAGENMDTTIDYAFTIKLLLPDLPTAAQQDGYPLSGRYPTTAWKPGTAFCEWIPLHVRPGVTPRAYDLFVGLYVLDGEPVYFRTSEGERSNFLTLDKIGIIAPEDKTENPPEPRFHVGDWGGLLDYDLNIENDLLTLRLDWLALASNPARYKYFLHALDSNGNIITQLDREPLDGAFPTDFWKPGVMFSDTLTLSLPPDSEIAEFRFGVYDPATGQRSIWSDGADSIRLTLP